MKKALAYTMIAGVLALVAVPASAQTSDNAAINATADVLGTIAVTAGNDLNFGFVFPGGSTKQVLYTDGTNAGTWSIAGTSFGAQVSLTFGLPANLTGPGGNLPIAFATTNAAFNTTNTTAGATVIDPNIANNANLSGTGALFVFLGGTVDPTLQATAGTYSGSISLTAAYTGN